MSYIVKSETFPESCNKCDSCYMCPGVRYCSLSHQADGKHLDVKDYFYNNTKHPDCPLLELPKKHGRLIDADRLTKILQDTLDNYSDNYNDGKTVEKLVVDVCKQFIEHCPTIIEAEVGE